MKLCEIVGLLGTQMLKEAYYYPWKVIYTTPANR
jgi:hypothetical protein